MKYTRYIYIILLINIIRRNKMLWFNKKNKIIISCEKAIKWLKNNIHPNQGLMISSNQNVSYTEVTGYTIPTLYQWGEKELAGNLVLWLIQQQNEDGSFSAPDGTPYTFDTGQVIRGFLAGLKDLPDAEKPLRKACDWILNQVQPDGRLATPSTEMWTNVADDRIHLYVLPPLIEAGVRLNEPKYVDAAHSVLNYYKRRKDLVDFNTLSHFVAYIIEALCDLGEIDLAKAGMEQVIALQRKDGSLPAYKDVSWICSTGVAQFAIIGYKLGVNENADKAMHYLETIQNRSGGFYGSYGKGADYFPKEEISWAVKFFLDANYWEIKTAFDKEMKIFSDSIDEKDGRVREILSFLGDVNDKRVIDVGCRKGRYLKIFKERYPKSNLYGVDISEKMLNFCPKEIETVSGSLLDIPYPNAFFDCVYSVEALEHAIMTENAIKEMVRVLKPEGKIIIIYKNKNMLGMLKIEPWEQWFSPKETIKLLQKYGIEAQYKQITYGTQTKPDGLFIAWTGIKK
jgi:malonyl-CoA O-methyltransferase